ncbi:hypothetical protein BDR03DRAFT_959661 [Suillus americanus]|nr:hypothetical protein BDR03DRAFT_959661 [Suillus americanus]
MHFLRIEGFSSTTLAFIGCSLRMRTPQKKYQLWLGRNWTASGRRWCERFRR